MIKENKKKIILSILAVAFLSAVTLGYFFTSKYYAKSNSNIIIPLDKTIQKAESQEKIPNIPAVPIVKINPEDNVVVTHLDTPVPLKAVYMSSWVAGTNSFRTKIINTIKKTELNAVVIDVKDYTGRISFSVNDPMLVAVGSAEHRIRDIKSFIADLHKNNIYVIGRIATFQDPYLAKKWKQYAVKKLSNKDVLWQDNKCKREIARGKESQCTYWVDSGEQKVWDYAVAIGKEAYSDGFDELNYDYIRFPADGDMKDIYFPTSQGKVKQEVMRNFFKYLHDHIAGENNEIKPRPKLSGDIFGMTMTNTDDLNIGQQLEADAPYFDYLAPMVYPSHFPNGWNNFKNPATKPYEVVKISMGQGVERLKTAKIDPLKLRPWLQDFNLGAIYTKELVRAQIKATYDVGLNSWMLWDPGNTYTESALLPE